MVEAIKFRAKSSVCMQVGYWKRRYPVIVINRGRNFARVRFLVDCEPLGVRKGDADIVAVDLLMDDEVMR